MMKIRSRVLAAIASVCLLYLNSGSVAMGGTLLPNGMQYFADENGLPLAAGCVYFYIPGTTSPKATYQNSSQTTANQNPVALDAAGRAIIYGTGTYRQVVKKAGPNAGLPCSPAGDQVWDQLTASTDSSTTIFAGASAGTPNAITVTAAAFSGTDGQVINYISTNTNTAAATINPSGFGAVQIVRDSATGPAPLTGGELVATNAVSLIYDATAGTFHILSPVTWPNTSGVPVGTSIEVRGFTAPTNYAFTYGQAVSRTTYAALFAALTNDQSGTISSGSPTITGLSDTTQFGRGMAVESLGIPAGATVLGCTSTTCTLSANATTSRTGTMTFFAYGNGDGSTTFNLPDDRGMVLVARDNMGGVAANISQISTTLTTSSGSSSATVGSAAGLAISMVITSSNVPSGAVINSISGTTITMSAPASGSAIAAPARFSVFQDAQGLGIAGGAQSKAIGLADLPTGITSANASQNITMSPPSAAFALASGTTLFSSTAGGSPFFQAPLATANNITTANSISVTSTNTGGVPSSFIPPSRIVNRAIKLTP